MAIGESKRNPEELKGLTLTNKKAFFARQTVDGQAIRPGDEVEFIVEEYGPRSLHGRALTKSSIQGFSKDAGLPFR